MSVENGVVLYSFTSIIIYVIFILYVVSLSEKIGLDKRLWIAYSKRISILFYIIFIVILWYMTEWFNFNILIISLPFGITCITIIWILIFGIILVFRAKEIPIEYRGHDYLRRLSILIPTIMVILVFILYQSFPIVQDYFGYDYAIEGITEETIEKYINENIKGVVYTTVSYPKSKFIIYIFNNGDLNIDKDLQFYLDFSYFIEGYKISKPDDELNLSYYGEETKPWVFGNDVYTKIRWNESLPHTTLLKKESIWAIFYLESTPYPIEMWEVAESRKCSAIIDDEHEITVVMMPLFVDPPTENPQDWVVNDILEDIELYS